MKKYNYFINFWFINFNKLFEHRFIGKSKLLHISKTEKLRIKNTDLLFYIQGQHLINISILVFKHLGSSKRYKKSEKLDLLLTA